MAGLLDGISEDDIGSFHRDLIELYRIESGIDEAYASSSDVIDIYLQRFGAVLDLANKKYRNIKFSGLGRYGEYHLLVMVREERKLGEVLQNVAANISGLQSIGSKAFGEASVQSPESIKKQAALIKERLYLTYMTESGTPLSFFLQISDKKGYLKVNFQSSAIHAHNSPVVTFLAYYAAKDGIGVNIDIRSETHRLGFARPQMTDQQHNEFIERFDPYLGE